VFRLDRLANVLGVWLGKMGVMQVTDIMKRSVIKSVACTLTSVPFSLVLSTEREAVGDGLKQGMGAVGANLVGSSGRLPNL
jgi:hypothetical protein